MVKTTHTSRSDLSSLIETWIQETITELYPDDDRLAQACRYALTGGGKRIRPMLSLLVAQTCGVQPISAKTAAMAVEWIHTYSLVHDDLPTLDNDDLRRGRATVHKAFDEPTAILVGDALLTDAFALAASSSQPDSPSYDRVEAVRILAKAAGGRGMVLGQHWDLIHTHCADTSIERLNAIHEKKTALLIAASCQLGALSAGVNHATSIIFADFGLIIGRIFQIIDDLLDDTPHTGKTPGKDARTDKLATTRVMSNDRALAHCHELMAHAHLMLKPFGSSGEDLWLFVEQLLKRTY